MAVVALSWTLHWDCSRWHVACRLAVDMLTVSIATSSCCCRQSYSVMVILKDGHVFGIKMIARYDISFCSSMCHTWPRNFTVVSTAKCNSPKPCVNGSPPICFQHGPLRYPIVILLLHGRFRLESHCSLCMLHFHGTAPRIAAFPGLAVSSGGRAGGGRRLLCGLAVLVPLLKGHPS